MPTAVAAGQQAQSQAASRQKVAAQPKPFCQASKHGHRLVGSANPGVSASPAAIGPFSLTASGGFVKRYILESIFSGGAGSGVLAADAPWNEDSLITLSEPNNNPVLNLSGYNMLLADVYGGYAMGENPTSDPDFSTGGGNNPVLYPYIPIEIDPTGLGALSDLSSSSGYQLYLLPNPVANVWSTAPTTLPTRQVNVYAEYWTLPEKQDGRGTPQAIVPPRAGTIQMWNQILNIVLSAGGGNQEMQLNRMGNRLRTVGIVTRAAGARSDAVFPNPARLEWDDIILKGVSPAILRKLMVEKVLNQSTRPIGAHFFFYNEGITRFVGGNGASSWLPTVSDTRYALQGNFPAASTPTMDWLINDVSYAPLGAVERTSVGPSSPGYHPAIPTETMPA